MRSMLAIAVCGAMLVASAAGAQTVGRGTTGGQTGGHVGGVVGGTGSTGGNGIGGGSTTSPNLNSTLPTVSTPPVVKPAQPAVAAPAPVQVVPPRPPKAGAQDGGDTDGCDCWRSEIVTVRRQDGAIESRTVRKKTGQKSSSCCPR